MEAISDGRKKKLACRLSDGRKSLQSSYDGRKTFLMAGKKEAL